ncbi:MAG: pilus assembly protein PilP [Desulfobacterota bacterium]|nr:pilus assembly protein PilP [Thermodesulfobacteriota bacterium]
MVRDDGSGQLVVNYFIGEELRNKLSSPLTGNLTLQERIFLTDEEVREQFTGEGIKVEKVVIEEKGNQLRVSYTIDFDNLQSFLATKALVKEDISFYQDKNRNLVFQWDTRRVQQLLKEQKIAGDFSLKFSLVLPGKIMESNADQVEENNLFWIYRAGKLFPEILSATSEGKGLIFLAQLPSEAKRSMSLGFVYDPTGKPDPFKPFIVEAKRSKEMMEKFLQPLQRYELSQLKLVGIIWNIDIPRPLVEDAAGKGYIITRGTFIGKNGGKVADILPGEIIVIEESPDIFGEGTKREVKIKLHTGEEEREVK